MGGPDILNIWRKVAKLDQNQRAAIGLKVREKASGRLRMPGSAALTAWLQENSGLLPRGLALDGKTIASTPARFHAPSNQPPYEMGK